MNKLIESPVHPSPLPETCPCWSDPAYARRNAYCERCRAEAGMAVPPPYTGDPNCPTCAGEGRCPDCDPIRPVHLRAAEIVAMPPDPSNSLAEYLERQAGHIEYADLQRQEDPIESAWLVRRLRELAREARFLRATDPETFEDRSAAMAASRDRRIEDEAFAAGERHAVRAMGGER